MSTLFAWPAKAKLDARVPQDKLFRAAGGGVAIRALYRDQVKRIDWAFKLFERSTNLPAADGVEEIEVFRIRLAGDRLDDRILAHIDKGVPHQTVFELVRAAPDGDEVQVAAGYKRRSEADQTQTVTAEHWRSGWTPVTSARMPLPQAASLDGLYAGLLRSLWPYPSRSGETLRDQAARMTMADEQARIIHRLETRLRREANFARKTGINCELRDAKAALKGLTETA